MEDLPCIVWLRRDLRIQDNNALIEASKSNQPIIVVYIHSDHRVRKQGKASALWLLESLRAFSRDLQNRGLQLVLRKGDPKKILVELVKESRATKVFFNKSYEPDQLEQDIDIARELKKRNVDVEMSSGNVLIEPWDLYNKQQKPFQVFTHFWKAVIERPFMAPRKAPSSFFGYKKLTTATVDDLGLPSGEMPKQWTPGEIGAKSKYHHFLKHVISDYNVTRDIPSCVGTSLLSPHLHFGEISVRTIMHDIVNLVEGDLLHLLKNPRKDQLGIECFAREIGWREFAAHLLYHFPHTQKKPLREKFEEFPWIEDKNALISWQKGMTGYPIVDAGMRQLTQTGWMHNRVRMIVGSFLVKHLLISWQKGEAWFWDMLFDADLASNILGWQWVQGCGADAAPYFRIFNPVLQGEKFDKDGKYIRQFIPELKDFPNSFIHKPWLAPKDVLQTTQYPRPIVNHDFARKRALEAFEKIKNSNF